MVIHEKSYDNSDDDDKDDDVLLLLLLAVGSVAETLVVMLVMVTMIKLGLTTGTVILRSAAVPCQMLPLCQTCF